MPTSILYRLLSLFLVMGSPLGGALFSGNQALAQSATASASNKVRSILRNVGAPLDIVYEDGRVASVYRREKLDEFRAPVVLSENSCKPVVGLKCEFVLPFVRQSFVGIWKTHPQRRGQVVQYAADKNTIFGTQIIITRSQSALFESTLSRMTSEGVGSAERNRNAIHDKTMARLECSGPLESAMPDTREIVYWDETFENGNIELSITSGFGARVNLIWQRLEGLPFKVSGGTLNVARYKRAYSMYTDYYPIGVAYVIQMNFKAPNLIEPSDEMCQIKWDVNFTEYFSQVVSTLSSGGTGPFNPEGYKLYLDTIENNNPHARRLFQKEQWEQAVE